MAMSDAAHPAALAMHACAPATPELEIFRLQCPFPAAGVGPFIDGECGRCSATAPVQEPPTCSGHALFLGRRELDQVPA